MAGENMDSINNMLKRIRELATRPQTEDERKRSQETARDFEAGSFAINEVRRILAEKG